MNRDVQLLRSQTRRSVIAEQQVDLLFSGNLQGLGLALSANNN